jgi:hypothetical protein
LLAGRGFELGVHSTHHAYRQPVVVVVVIMSEAIGQTVTEPERFVGLLARMEFAWFIAELERMGRGLVKLNQTTHRASSHFMDAPNMKKASPNPG